MHKLILTIASLFILSTSSYAGSFWCSSDNRPSDGNADTINFIQLKNGTYEIRTSHIAGGLCPKGPCELQPGGKVLNKLYSTGLLCFFGKKNVLLSACVTDLKDPKAPETSHWIANTSVKTEATSSLDIRGITFDHGNWKAETVENTYGGSYVEVTLYKLDENGNPQTETDTFDFSMKNCHAGLQPKAL